MGPRVGLADGPVIRGARVSREKRALARQFRREPTSSEQRAWQLLRNRRCLGLKFRRQQVIRGYIVDFYCAELRLVVEIDGEVHCTLDRFGYDLERSEHLKKAGIHYELHLRPEDVSEATLEALLAAVVLPLSRAAGEGAGG
jgi:very-short-patch-repair endonuclease